MKRHRNDPPPHGDHRRYKYWKCRCEDCREAARLIDKRRREGRAPSLFTDSTATIRRVRALVAAGHDFSTLGQRLGCAPSWPSQIAHDRLGPRGVLVRTADQVQRLAEELLDQPAPAGRASAYARAVATRHSWHPIEAWDDVTIGDPDAEPYQWCRDDVVDEVLVRRALNGHATWGQLNKAERAELVRLRGDRSLTELAAMVGVSRSTFRGFVANLRGAA